MLLKTATKPCICIVCGEIIKSNERYYKFNKVNKVPEKGELPMYSYSSHVSCKPVGRDVEVTYKALKDLELLIEGPKFQSELPKGFSQVYHSLSKKGINILKAKDFRNCGSIMVKNKNLLGPIYYYGIDEDEARRRFKERIKEIKNGHD